MKRWLIGIAGGIVALVIAATVVAHFAFDREAIRGAIEQQAGKALDASVKIGAADISIFPRAGVSLKNIEVNGKFHITAQSVRVSTSLRQLFQKRIEDGEIHLKSGLIELSPSYATAGSAERQGTPQQNPSRKVEKKNREAESQSESITIASIRSISIEDLQLVGGGKRLRLDAHGSLTPDELKLKDLTLTAGSTEIHGSGLLLNDPKILAGNLNLTAEQLDLDELMSVTTSLASALPKQQNATPSAPKPDTATTHNRKHQKQEASNEPPAAERAAEKTSISSSLLHVTIAASAGKLYGMEFQNLKLTATRSGPDTVLDPFSVSLFGGDVDGRVTISSRAMAASLAASVTIKNADVARFLKACNQAPSVTGKLNGTVLLSGRGADFNAAATAMAGTANLTMIGGEIKGLNALSKGLTYLGATPSKPDAPNSYQQLGGAFRIQPSGVTTDNLELTAPDFQLQSSLSLTRAGALDGSAKLLLDEDVSQQILKKNRDLKYAAEKNRIVLPADIGGTMAKPRVLPDMGDITKRAAKSAIEDAATKSLKKLFKKKP